MTALHPPQPGIFALGTASHAYLELDLAPGATPRVVVEAVAALDGPQTTIGGVNLVAGFRPELWASVAPDEAPAGLSGFDLPLRSPDGFAMPATQHDVLLWVAGAAYDVVFDVTRGALRELVGLATAGSEVSSWPYRHDRDLTGFQDGTENPPLDEAHEAALIASGPGAGGSVVLIQQWEHDAEAWEALDGEAQERIMGRTKADSVELEDRAGDSHVARTDQEDFGHIFRRNTPYGTATEHGTMFVGFSADQGRLTRMLEAMAGLDCGPRDALTRYARPLTGAYYFVPAIDVLGGLASPPK